VKHFKNFEIKKNQDSFDIFLSIKEYIEGFTDQNFLSKHFEKCEEILKCPKNILKLKFKKLIYNSFDHKEKKILISSSYLNIFKDYFFFVFSFSVILILNRSKNKNKKYDLIIEDIEDINQIERFKKLYSRFEKILVIYKHSKFNDLNKIKDYSFDKINSKHIIPNNSFTKDQFFKSIKFITNILLLSLKEKTNFVFFFRIIFFSFVKNNTLYKKNTAKFLIHDRIYATCPIRNYLFKKHGGKFTACTQLHLAEAGLSLYTDIDILFLLGNENDTKKKVEILGGNIGKTFVTGSHKMESNFFSEKTKKINFAKIDLLIIGINLNHWIYNSERVFNGYYKYLEWIKKFSIENQNLNIVYKHHSNFIKDEKESQILKNTNIKMVIKSPTGENSYDYLDNSKMIVSYGSTMILEGRSMNRNCFFLDPDSSATTFYKHLGYLNNIILNTYQDFEAVSKKVINDETLTRKIDSNSFCIKSNNVSDKIYEHFSIL